MSGHSKWHNIKHRKAGADAKRGKIFTRHAKLIQIAAASGGGDADMNPVLRAAIDSARADNVPMDNIERAIKKGTGESKDAAQFEEVFYEGFGPGGVALYIETLTDNRNRTVSNLNTIIGKRGGKMGAAGSVGYLFQRKGLLTISSEGKNEEEIELAAIDAGANDVKSHDGSVEIYTDPTDLTRVAEHIKKNGIEVESSRLVFVPQSEVSLTGESAARQLMELIDALEEDDDVNTVYTNADISEDLLEKI